MRQAPVCASSKPLHVGSDRCVGAFTPVRVVQALIRFAEKIIGDVQKGCAVLLLALAIACSPYLRFRDEVSQYIIGLPLVSVR